MIGRSDTCIRTENLRTDGDHSQTGATREPGEFRSAVVMLGAVSAETGE